MVTGRHPLPPPPTVPKTQSGHMQPEAAERRREAGRRGRTLEEQQEAQRSKTKTSSSQQTEGGGGGGGEEVPSGDKERRGRREASGAGEERRRLRWRINQLEKEKLKLNSEHNQEVCRLTAELTRLRSAVERGEAQGAELQYQLTLSCRDKRALAERAARLQQDVDAARRAQRQDQHALQQEAEERRRLAHGFAAESERLRRTLQEQEEALQEASRRREQQAQKAAEEVKLLKEREERSRKEKELLDQRVAALQSNVEAERDAHLHTKYTCELLQLRLREEEAALAAARSGQQEAQCGLERLRTQLGEAQRAYGEERRRSASAERALHRLRAEYERCESELRVAVETERRTTSDLSRGLEEEKRGHARTQTLLQQALQARSGAEEASQLLLRRLAETLQPRGAEAPPPPEHHGKRSPAEETLQLLKTTLEESRRQLEELRASSDRQQEELQTLRLLSSQQEAQLQEAQQEVVRLQEELSDWSRRSRELKAELQREREEREQEEKEKEAQERKEEEERGEREKEVQQLKEQQQTHNAACFSFLHSVYQRLLAGCVLLPQPQGMLGNFTWTELCDVISEQLDQLTSDLRAANQKVVRLQCVCNKKTVCVRELHKNHKFVLSRLEESVRRREEAHGRTLTQLQLQSDSLTSDLSESRGRAASLVTACALLGGALRHAHRRLGALREQKALLRRRLEEREQLEEEVKRLAEALRREEEEEQEEEEEARRRRRTAARRWRRSVCVVTAVRRWRELGRRSTVLLRAEGGGGAPPACVCGVTTDDEDDDEEGACGRWLRSERLCSAVLASVCDLQAELDHHGSAPLIPAARSALSRLLQFFLDQSDAVLAAAAPDAPSGGVRREESRPGAKALVSALQQHFLLFSQRLHSAEVERRGLRLEVANLKRGLQEETVSAQRFHSVCEELRQALSREEEAQSIIREQSDTRHTLSHTSQALSKAQQELSRKERSLRIVGKHLSEVQRARRRIEGELSDSSRRRDLLIGCLKAAETSCKQIRNGLVQSRASMAQPRPLLVPWEQLQLSGAESMMGTAELEACQGFLSAVSQLCHACSSRIDWLEQEVSAHRGHVTALRAELQDACLRDNQAFVPVAGFEDAFPLADAGAAPPLLRSDSSKDLPVCDTAHSHSGPAPSSATLPESKT